MARTQEQLRGWSDIIELCDDECEVVCLTPAIRQSVLETEREMRRLSAIEAVARVLAQMIVDPAVTDDECVRVLRAIGVVQP